MSEFTVSVWIKAFLNLPSPVIVANGNVVGARVNLCGKGVRAGWVFFIDDTNATLAYCNSTSYDKNFTKVKSTRIISNDTWTHLSIVFDTQNISFFVDGALTDSYSSGGIMYDNITTDITIGAQDYNEANVFNGTIDEVRIWNRSLSSDEVYQQYVSNLNKHNTTQWYLYVNQSLNATDGLDDGTYNYQTYAKDRAGNWNQTEGRSVVVSTGVSATNCGNGVKEGTEECDTGEFGGESCSSKGYRGGNLRCTVDCKIDASSCSGLRPSQRPSPVAKPEPTPEPEVEEVEEEEEVEEVEEEEEEPELPAPERDLMPYLIGGLALMSLLGAFGFLLVGAKRMKDILSLIMYSEELIKAGRFMEAGRYYIRIRDIYMKLSKKGKRKVHNKVKILYDTLIEARKYLRR